jgi:hypothetical protein
MRNAQGYAVIVSPDPSEANFDGLRCEQVVGTVERDTFTCCHCNRVIHVRPKAPMDEFGSMCRNCMKMVCPDCANGGCTPFLKQIDEMEKRDYIRRQYAMML